MIGEVCRRVGVSETTFRRLEAKGVLPAAERVELAPGRGVRVLRESEVDEVVRALERWRERRIKASKC